MEVKKSPKANLERTKTVYFLAGLVFATGILLAAVEHKTYGKEVSDLGTIEMEEEDVELPPITRATPPPPPPPPPPPVAPPKIEVVEDDVEIEEEIEFEEIDEDYEVDPVIEEEVEEEVEEIFMKVENMPVFPGCEDLPFAERDPCTKQKIMQHCAQNFKMPPQAKEHGISGRILVGFVVDKDGTITDIEIIRSLHKVVDSAAIEAVKSLPLIQPGEQLGKKVKVRYVIPMKISAR